MDTLGHAIGLLREANQAVPKPVRLPTIQEVFAIEKSHDLLFHDDFKRYLLEASDVSFGTFEPVTITEPESHTYFPEVLSSARACGVPKELIPLCEDNAEFYCMTHSGQILFWSQNGTTDESWDDMAIWIEEVWMGEADDWIE